MEDVLHVVGVVLDLFEVNQFRLAHLALVFHLFKKVKHIASESVKDIALIEER